MGSKISASLAFAGLLGASVAGAPAALGQPGTDYSVPSGSASVSVVDGELVVSVPDTARLQVVRASGDSLGNLKYRAVASPRTTSAGRMRVSVVADDTGRVVDTAIERTFASPTAPGAGTNGSWVRTQRSVGIVWPEFDGVDTWTVTTPSGAKVTTSRESYVSNSSAQSGTYSIVGRNSTTGKLRTFAIGVPDAPDRPMGGRASATTTASQALLNTGTAADAAAPSKMEPHWRGVAWDAFIPEETVEAKALGLVKACPEALVGVHHYNGNGRDFFDSAYQLDTNPEHRPYKVFAAVGSFAKSDGWVKPDIYDALIARGTGETRGFDADGNEIRYGHANAETDIRLTSGSSSNVSSDPSNPAQYVAKRSVEIESPNPLCTGAPAISVNFDYTDWAPGWTNVRASHDRAPSHELFWGATDDEAVPNKQNGCLYRLRRGSFENLANTPLNNADVTVDFNPNLETPKCVTVDGS